jgi:hypothetical protein
MQRKTACPLSAEAGHMVLYLKCLPRPIADMCSATRDVRAKSGHQQRTVRERSDTCYRLPDPVTASTFSTSPGIQLLLIAASVGP